MTTAALLLAIAFPVFLVSMAVEALYARWRGLELYHFPDTVANLGCGIVQQATGLVAAASRLAIYAGVYQLGHVFEIPADTVWGWVVALLGVDLAYYWAHRTSHRVNLGWAAHVVHHQSEEYNLSVALRQSALQRFWSLPFSLPLAVLGVPWQLYLAAATVNMLYQFWIHTRAIGSLGPLEWVLNTPSHHRVHHGIDPRYIDKNYAGMLIVWDRLFGTFTPESGEPVYGTVAPLQSWNPVWAQVDHWAKLWHMSRTTARWVDKLQLWLRPPEWRPADLGGVVTIPEVQRATQVRYRGRATRLQQVYVSLGFLAIVAGLAGLLVAGQPSMELLASVALLMVAGTGVWGGLLEGRAWARPVEAVRLLALVALAAWWSQGTPHAPLAIGASVAVAALSLLAFPWLGPQTPMGLGAGLEVPGRRATFPA